MKFTVTTIPQDAGNRYSYFTKISFPPQNTVCKMGSIALQQKIRANLSV